MVKEQQQHREAPNTLTVARIQLRALVEEKENINTYLSRLALESQLAAHPKKLTKENIGEVRALTRTLASRKELAASLTSSVLATQDRNLSLTSSLLCTALASAQSTVLRISEDETLCAKNWTAVIQPLSEQFEVQIHQTIQSPADRGKLPSIHNLRPRIEGLDTGDSGQGLQAAVQYCQTNTDVTLICRNK